MKVIKKVKKKIKVESQENKNLGIKKILGKYPDNKEYLLCGAGKTSVNKKQRRIQEELFKINQKRAVQGNQN